jgi:gamma-glutamyltranspeptidase/glutathione hydrolase
MDGLSGFGALRGRVVRRALIALVLAASACARGPAPAGPPAPSRAVATGKDSGNRELREFTTADWRWRDGATVARGRRGMITSNEPIASRVGLDILRAGGNAVDAAVAVGFALAVTYPEAGNLGGGGFMLIRLADGRTAAFDYREMAPAAATREMFVGPDGGATDASRVGHRASGVPGSVAGLWAAHRAHGKLPWIDVVAPALALARDGFVVDSSLHAALQGARGLITRFSGREIFFPGGQALAVGTVLRQPALANTLARIAEKGPDGFYKGPTAEGIAAEMRRGGGLITTADLAAYRVRERDVLRGSYRGHTILAMPPASSGGIAVIEALNILETWPTLAPPGSAAQAHQLGSALQLAFIDRNAKVGDPDAVPVPIAELTSKSYARGLRARIAEEHATPTPVTTPPRKDSPETTHYNVVDGEGNAVVTTTTINDLFGSGVYVPEVGIFLNDEMDDFAARPGVPNAYGLVQGEANAIAPGKRMLSSMTPTMVLGPDGTPMMLAGARGGALIISAVLQLIVNVVDHRMPLSQAIAAPRWHHQGLPDVLRYEAGGVPSAVLDELRRMGWTVEPGGTGRTTVIVRDPSGAWVGAVDPRREGLAIGW